VTDSKVLNRLMDFAPRIIAAYSSAPTRCIGATAVGCEVLQHFGIVAAPFPVLVEVVNAAWVAAQRRGADPVTAIARGGHVLLINPDPGAAGWSGHLMIHVPSQHTLIDLDFQQFGRPHERIDAAPAEVFAWPSGTTTRTFQDATGARITIQATTDDTYTRARDWYDVDRRAPMRAAIIRAITKNRL
jgi:hypothetical protein